MDGGSSAERVRGFPDGAANAQTEDRLAKEPNRAAADTGQGTEE